MNRHSNQRQPAPSPMLDANGIFKVALSALELERRELAMAVDRQKAEDIAHAAAELVRVWIIACERCDGVIALSGERSPLAVSAKKVLQDYFVSAQDLFMRAKQLALRGLSRKVDGLASTLTAANDARASREETRILQQRQQS